MRLRVEAIVLKTKLRVVLLLAAMVLLSGFFMRVDGAATSYTYDSLNRLTQTTYSDGTVITYTYDAAGNRLGQSVTSVPTPTPTPAPTAPPTATTEAPSNVTSTSATLHGTVNPNGLSTIVDFEYGPTASYGSSTPPQNALSGTAPIPALATFTNLSPNTTYHYRIVATNSGGTSTGDDVSFTTNLSALDVTNTNSQGGGSLLEALTVANATPSVKTITFN